MTRENYLTAMDEFNNRWMELRTAAMGIGLNIIRQNFPDVPEKVKINCSYDCVFVHPNDAELYILNMKTGSVYYLGNNLRRMFDAAAVNPNNYTIIQRGSTAVFVVWRGSDASILRFDTVTGEQTGELVFREIRSDEDGDYCSWGRSRIRKPEGSDAQAY